MSGTWKVEMDRRAARFRETRGLGREFRVINMLYRREDLNSISKAHVKKRPKPGVVPALGRWLRDSQLNHTNKTLTNCSHLGTTPNVMFRLMHMYTHIHIQERFRNLDKSVSCL